MGNELRLIADLPERSTDQEVGGSNPLGYAIFKLYRTRELARTRLKVVRSQLGTASG